MYSTYILESQKDKNHYIGVTIDVEKRLKEHNQGKVKSTRFRRPLVLLKFETFETKTEAIRREKELKMYRGWKERLQLRS